ncbi:MAG TPA: hypothetical protein DEQ14_00860, partial [Treponema sp.]|nr:hypothetical protein [Treponema sp.]
ELSGLRQALSQAESSLVSLEQSFAAYRVAAEMRIQSLEKSRDIWRIAFFAACAVGAGAVGAVLISGK